MHKFLLPNCIISCKSLEESVIGLQSTKFVVGSTIFLLVLIVISEDDGEVMNSSMACPGRLEEASFGPTACDNEQ